MGSIKTYTNGDITIHWEAKKCWHYGACVAMLPEVYDPEAQPWITPDKATTPALKKQIAQCPSGALSYTSNNKKIAQATDGDRNISLLENGPITSKKEIQVTYDDHTTETKYLRRSYCRCGASDNLPYCNGNHAKVDFKAAAHTPE